MYMLPSHMAPGWQSSMLLMQFSLFGQLKIHLQANLYLCIVDRQRAAGKEILQEIDSCLTVFNFVVWISIIHLSISLPTQIANVKQSYFRHCRS